MPRRAPPASRKGIQALFPAGAVLAPCVSRRGRFSSPPWSGRGLSTPDIENFVVDTIFPIMVSGILEVIDLQVLGSWLGRPWNLRWGSEL